MFRYTNEKQQSYDNYLGLLGTGQPRFASD